VDRWEHYFDIYDRHLSKYQDKPVKVLEIGVSHGGSLQIWKAYFGSKAAITGIDIDPRCRDYAEAQIDVIITDQANPAIGLLGEFDIVIDDGSHVSNDQSASFARLWPHTRGVYLIEDCHEGFPWLAHEPALVTKYPWVLVCERPKRLIRGNPSRDLRPDEIDAINLYSDL
jgi:hypothetical protein